MGTRRATIKWNPPVIMMGQGATLTEKKNQLKYRYDARLFTLWINNTSTGILIGCWGRAFLIPMIDDASIMDKVTPGFSRQTYLEWSETSAQGSSSPLKIQFFCDKTATLTEITGIEFEYADPENGRSKFWRHVSNYLPVARHTS